MPDQPVDWRELTRMPMFLEVTRCGDCELQHDSDMWGPECHHPNAPDGLRTEHDTVPSGCPLRSGSLTIQLAATLR